jgi:alginate O-acetyltransferase complex protein AlgI
MLFNSLNFIVFYVIITIAYFQLPYKFRWILLLMASCYFYMAFVPIYILILGFTIIIDYFAGIKIEYSEGRQRRLFLILSLCANIGVLAVFKYYNFLNETLGRLHLFNNVKPLPVLKLLLPIGLSFHTFQAMSYTIEVYRRKQKAERNLGIYALYVMFYPQLVAGPIERPQNLLHQFYATNNFDFEKLKSGLIRMAWGLFKKVVIADRIALVVDNIYGNLPSQNGSAVILAVFLYSFQIYCDFSGYSDIAIGAAETMGIKLMENFNAPYFSKSISEFWKRWHISLSTWFKDYLYIPLGGNRLGMPKWYFNLLLVFLISGLWHGANWTFIVWGGLHGLYMIMGVIKSRMRDKMKRPFQLPEYFKYMNVLLTFGLVSFAWIFFRSVNLHHAISIIKKISSFSIHDNLFRNLNESEVLFSFFLIFLLILKDKFYTKISTLNTPFTVIKFFFLILLIYLFGVFNNGTPFIYFQF